jgi:hypothetical protein
VFEHPVACALALLDQSDSAFVLENIDLVTGLNMETVTDIFRYRNLTFQAQQRHGAASLLIRVA